MKTLLRIAVPIAVVTVLAISASFYQQTRQLFPISIAVPPYATSALAIIADKENFFRDRGLAVDFKFFPTGSECVKAMMQGQVDIAQAYVTPLALEIAKGSDIAILTQLHTAHDNTLLVYRKDRGITTPEDLIGKKVGYVPGTNAQFFLNLFLNLQFMDVVDVQHVHLSAANVASSLTEGKVDAIVMWQPQSGILAADPSGTYGYFSSEVYSDYSAAAVHGAYLRKNPEVLRRFLLALDDALKYYRSDKTRAQTLVFEEIQQSSAPMNTWRNLSIHLGLTNIFRTTLEEEVAWAQQNTSTQLTATRQPIQAQILSELLPDKVLLK